MSLKPPTPENIDVWLRDPLALIRDVLILDCGEPYGEVWQPFQREFFAAVFAVRPGGAPLHRLCYREDRRGESKTTDLAAALLADLVTGPAGHRSFFFAADQDQAGLGQESVENFVSRHVLLQEMLDVQRWTIKHKRTGSTLRIMSSDAPTSFGIRPHKIGFDEFSLQEDERLWLPTWSAVGKRADAQMLITSMAGNNFASLAWRIREMAIVNPAYWFSSREDTEPAPWLSRDQMEEQRATLHPADYARFWECRWVEPKGSWITREMYDAAETGREAIAAVDGQRSVGFVDVGLVRDATAVAVCHREDDRVVADTLCTLQGTRDAPVELEVLEDLVLDLTSRFHVARWTFEAPQAVASVQRLQKRLGSTAVTARYPTVETQARLFGTLYQLFANHRLVLFPHEQLRKEAMSLVTKTVGGRMKVVESSSIHQDHVIALGGAAEMAMSGAGTSTADMAGTFAEANAALGRANVNRPELSYGAEYQSPGSTLGPTSTPWWKGG